VEEISELKREGLSVFFSYNPRDRAQIESAAAELGAVGRGMRIIQPSLPDQPRGLRRYFAGSMRRSAPSVSSVSR
jgi:hypothetical protein